ncbi:MAG TPA: DUF2203 family protein [Gemmataceae bacterium]|nr:DUF2203 family protein [Gemmataceae bacterium]
MNGSTENRAQGASEKPGRRPGAFNLATARRMLPLVQRIVSDVVSCRRLLIQIRPEQARLDRQRRTLAWPERSRRYQIQEEVSDADRRLQEAMAELAGLSIVLLDPEGGRIGFPTVVNNRQAFFSWQLGEEGITQWHFPEDDVRRPIPASWAKAANLRLTAHNA